MCGILCSPSACVADILLIPVNIVNLSSVSSVLSLSVRAAGGSPAAEALLCELCERLHAALARRRLLGRRCRRRGQILRTLFTLIDRDSARLHLHVATLCLAVSPSLAL